MKQMKVCWHSHTYCEIICSRYILWNRVLRSGNFHTDLAAHTGTLLVYFERQRDRVEQGMAAITNTNLMKLLFAWEINLAADCTRSRRHDSHINLRDLSTSGTTEPLIWAMHFAMQWEETDSYSKCQHRCLCEHNLFGRVSFLVAVI